MVSLTSVTKLSYGLIIVHRCDHAVSHSDAVENMHYSRGLRPAHESPEEPNNVGETPNELCNPASIRIISNLPCWGGIEHGRAQSGSSC